MFIFMSCLLSVKANWWHVHQQSNIVDLYTVMWGIYASKDSYNHEKSMFEHTCECSMCRISQRGGGVSKMKQKSTNLSYLINNNQVSESHSPEEVKDLWNRSGGWDGVWTSIHIPRNILQRKDKIIFNSCIFQQKRNYWIANISIFETLTITIC